METGPFGGLCLLVGGWSINILKNALQVLLVFYNHKYFALVIRTASRPKLMLRSLGV